MLRFGALPAARSASLAPVAATAYAAPAIAAVACHAAGASVASTSAIQVRGVQSAADAAGQHSFVKGLFFGHVNDKLMFPFPDVVSDEERETLTAAVDMVARFYEDAVDSKAIDETKIIPEEVLDGLRELGLFGLQIPEKYGGLGFTNTAYARLCEEVVADPSLAVTLMAHQSIGLKGILLNGNEEQKAKYLPKLASGEHMAAFALTEPSTGSDAGSVKTQATLSEDGKHWLLNGSKIWISNGGWAEIFTVFAQAQVDGESKMTAFIVEKSFGGVSSGPPEDKLGIRGSNTCEVFFENTPVPVENVLEGVGSGFKVAMNILNNGRFGLGAGSGAAIRKVAEEAAEHASQRVQFGSTLSSFGLIKKKFAGMLVDAYACESMAYATTGMIDRGDPSCELEAAICKVYGSDSAFRNVNEGIQVMGGLGFMKDYPFERAMRDSRILSIFEGTNEILRMLIALEGFRRVGPRLTEVAKAAKGFNLSVIGAEISSRLRSSVSSQEITGHHSNLDDVASLLSKNTALFGRAVEGVLSKYRKDVIHEQLVNERVANTAIDLFGTAATLSRASRSIERGLPSAAQEERLARVFAQQANTRIRANLKDITEKVDEDRLLCEIADDMFANDNKYTPPHPTGI